MAQGFMRSFDKKLIVESAGTEPAVNVNDMDVVKLLIPVASVPAVFVYAPTDNFLGVGVVAEASLVANVIVPVVFIVNVGIV